MRILVTPKTMTPAQSICVTPAPIVISARPLRILDFDIENRPLSYLGSDFTTAEVTALAWAWTDRPEAVTCYLLGETDPVVILRAFLAVYNQADMVTGHYVKGHDLPILNGALMEYQLPLLSDKLVCDTKLDLIRRKGLSMSQESLGAMLRLEHQKVTMNQATWRSANRLEPEGREAARTRVVGDVQQHIELRRRLLALGYLGPARIWKSSTARVEGYEP